MLQKVVFLDRDGVINREGSSYVTSWSELEFLPGSIEAIKRLTDSGFTTMLITNQSIVNRRMVARATLEAIHENMKQLIEAGGGRLKDMFFCPHRPEEGCGCRKPKPGMIFKAQKKHDIDLSTAIMVGDRSKDIECGQNAGCALTVLVKTGNGFHAERELIHDGNPPDHVAKDLYEAVSWIISRCKNEKKDKKRILSRRHP